MDRKREKPTHVNRRVSDAHPKQNRARSEREQEGNSSASSRKGHKNEFYSEESLPEVAYSQPRGNYKTRMLQEENTCRSVPLSKESASKLSFLTPYSEVFTLIYKKISMKILLTVAIPICVAVVILTLSIKLLSSSTSTSSKFNFTRSENYYGVFIGNLSEGCSGSVFAARKNVFVVSGFNLKNESSQTLWFHAVTTDSLQSPGIALSTGISEWEPIRFASVVVLGLPRGNGNKSSIKSFKIFGVWDADVNRTLCHVVINETIKLPQKAKLKKFDETRKPLISVDGVWAKTVHSLSLVNFKFDGTERCRFAVTQGTSEDSFILVADEKFALGDIGVYTGQNISVHLPDDVQLFDVNAFGIYSVLKNKFLTHIQLQDLPENLPADLGRFDVFNSP